MHQDRQHSAFLLLGVMLLLGACGRSLPEGPQEETPPVDIVPGEEPPGVFQAQAGQQNGGTDYEQLKGAASFNLVQTDDGTSIFVMRLASQLPGVTGTTMLDFALLTSSVPGPEDRSIGDLGDTTRDFSFVWAGCFRSSIFLESPYRSESGTLTVSTSGRDQFKGNFEMIAYKEVQTGPNAQARVRLPIYGTFNARRRVDLAVDTDHLFICEE